MNSTVTARTAPSMPDHQTGAEATFNATLHQATLGRPPEWIETAYEVIDAICAQYATYGLDQEQMTNLRG